VNVLIVADGIGARSECVNADCAMPSVLSPLTFAAYNRPLTTATGQGNLRCLPTNDAGTVIG
jgi:hypothetical protein